MPYATPQDLVTYYDASVVADLASDTDSPVPDVTQCPLIDQLLAFGAGRINSAATIGQRYSEDQLTALAGDDLQVLVQLNCTIAMGALLFRRPGSQYEKSYENHMKAAEEFLDRLRKGERIFAFPENQDAGLPLVDGPTVVDYARLRLPMDRFRNYFPSRGSTLPIGRQYG
jgi:phage gp36-like protein